MTTEYTLSESRKQTIQKIMSDLTVRKMSRMSPITTNVIMFELCDDQVILPFYYAKKTFNIEPNYKKSKYDKFDDIDIKKLKKSSDNISLSFLILIIIFAIILIEPTVI